MSTNCLARFHVCDTSLVEMIFLLLAAVSLTAQGSAATVRVSGTTERAITVAVRSACRKASGGTVIFPNGTYSVTSTIGIPGNCTLQAQNRRQAILNGSQNQILQIEGNGVTINGLVFNGGWVSFAGADTYSNFTFTNNTVQNITFSFNGGGPAGLQAPGLVSSTISNNIFQNLWGGGKGYPYNPDYASGSYNVTDSWGALGMSLTGMDKTTISDNVFDQIGNDAMHISWLSTTGNVGGHTTTGNVISYNKFTHIRRIPMEVQSQPSNNCPGGCNYGIVNTTGMQIKGNYVHDYAFPFYDTWGASLVPDGSKGTQYLNNTFIANPGNYNGYASAMETSADNGLVQGEVIASIPGAAHEYPHSHSYGGNSNPRYTITVQNNIWCGTAGSTVTNHEAATTSSATVTEQYIYKNATSCPAGTDPTVSNIALSFTSANNQSFPSAGNATWKLSVVSNLSIKYVQFFIDGASTPVVTQEIQDVNPNFSNDRKWLYHATLNTSTLATGVHTITAKATDVSDAVQTAGQTFLVKSRRAS